MKPNWLLIFNVVFHTLITLLYLFIDGDTIEDNGNTSFARGNMQYTFDNRINYIHFNFFHLISVPPRYDPVFRLSPPPSAYTFPCLIDPSEGAFEAFDIKPK